MFTGSIVRYPNRGVGGRSNWQGNTSPLLIKDLLETFQPRVFCDPACGSDTSGDVARQFQNQGCNIIYHGRDLHSGFDLLSHSLEDEIKMQADLILYHPAYFRMIFYSGNVWGTEPHPSDLSRCETYEEFITKLQRTMINAYSALKRGGRMAVQIGDYRKDGVYYPIQSHVASIAPGVIESIIIKEQNNCRSDRQKYNSPIIRIEHESIVIVRRDGVVFGQLDATLAISERLKMFANCTWRAIVEYAFEQLGNRATLAMLYDFIERHAHTRIKSEFYREKIRQTVQKIGVRLERGVWARGTAAHASAQAA